MNYIPNEWEKRDQKQNQNNNNNKNIDWLHKYYIQSKDLSGINVQDYFRQMLCELRKYEANANEEKKTLNNSLQFTTGMAIAIAPRSQSG